MKKVLKLILAIAIVAALAVTAFASPVQETVGSVTGGNGNTLTLDAGYDNDGGKLTAVVTTTEATDPDGEVVLAVDVTIYNEAGEAVSNPNASFTFTVDGLSAYVDKYITMKHNGVAVSSQRINGDSVSFAYTGSFSPFTFVITDAPLQTATSPQTSQTMLTGALVCVAAMAILGTAIAAKRKFD